MLKKNWKIAIFVALFILILGGGLGSFYVKEVVKKEEIQKSLRESLSKSLPGALVQIGDLNIEYGPSVLLTIDRFQIDQKFPVLNYDLLKVKKITVKVPVLSIFLGGGNIDVLLEGPELFLQEKKGDKNWVNAFQGSSKSISVDKNQPAEGQAQIVLPAFLLNSTATVRVMNSLLNYRLDEVSGSLNFSKLVLKNFGLNSVAAFEIQSLYSRKNSETEKEVYAFDFTLIGSVDFADYLTSHDLKIKSNFKISDLKIGSKPFPLNLIRGDVALGLNKTGNIWGDFRSSSSENELSTGFQIEKGNIFLKNLSGVIYPHEILPFFVESNPIVLNGSKLKVEGQLDIVEGQPNPTFIFDLSPFSFTTWDLKPKAKAKGRWLKDEINLAFELEELQGKLTSQIKANYVLNSSAPLEERITFYTNDIKIENLALNERLLFGWLHGLKSRGALKGILMPKGVTTFEMEGIKIGEVFYQGGGTIKTDRNSFELANFSFLAPEKSVKAKGKGELFEGRSLVSLDAEIKGIEIGSYFRSLGDKKKIITGITQGSLNGQWVFKEDPSENSFKTKFSLKVSDGELTGFKTNELLKELRGTIKKSLGGLKHLTYQSEDLRSFQSLEANFTLENNILSLNNFKIFPSETFFLTFNGNLDLEGKEETQVSLNLHDDQYEEKFLKKKTNLDHLPLSLKTRGWEFENDLETTLKGLVKKMRFKKDQKLMAQKLKQVSKQNDKGKYDEKSKPSGLERK